MKRGTQSRGGGLGGISSNVQIGIELNLLERNTGSIHMMTQSTSVKAYPIPRVP